jgi:transposase-like protein
VAVRVPAIDQYGQIIDAYVSARRDPPRSARRFFTSKLRAHGEPAEVATDRAPALRAAIEGLMPAAFHNAARCANMHELQGARPTTAPSHRPEEQPCPAKLSTLRVSD